MGNIYYIAAVCENLYTFCCVASGVLSIIILTFIVLLLSEKEILENIKKHFNQYKKYIISIIIIWIIFSLGAIFTPNKNVYLMMKQYERIERINN